MSAGVSSAPHYFCICTGCPGVEDEPIQCRAQIIFLPKQRHTRQLVHYDWPSAAYEPLHYAQPLEPDFLSLMLPGSVALEASVPHETAGTTYGRAAEGSSCCQA